MGEGIREGKEIAILIKRTFPDSEFFGSSLVLLWFILGLLHGAHIQGTREWNLNNRTFLVILTTPAFRHEIGNRK